MNEFYEKLAQKLSPYANTRTLEYTEDGFLLKVNRATNTDAEPTIASFTSFFANNLSNASISLDGAQANHHVIRISGLQKATVDAVKSILVV